MSQGEVSPLGGVVGASVTGDKVSPWDYPQGAPRRVPRLTAVTSDLSPPGMTINPRRFVPTLESPTLARRECSMGVPL